MVEVPTAEEFDTRLTAVETAIDNLRVRVTTLESANPPDPPPGGGTPGAPAVSGVQATAVSTSGATLAATVEPQALPYTWRFEYGTTTDYGSLAPLNASGGVAPVADVTATTSTLRQGSLTGARMLLAGMNVWGIADNITGSFGDDQYEARAAITATLKSWGVNYVRLRLYANYWNGLSQANKDALVGRVVDWRNTLRASGILTCPCWWDALDGPNAGANWDTNYDESFAMMSAVAAALGNDEYVFYEPFNEPNNISNSEWDTATRATIAHFRTSIGYKGLLVVDTNQWSHLYDDTLMTGIEGYDATLTGTGRANVAFARHDYGNEYPGNTWDPDVWTDENGGSAREHILLETEYGVYNQSTSTIPWGQGASAFFAAQMQTQTNLCGAAPFLFGPWLDPNAITTSDNVTPTTWGGYAKNDFLADANGSTVPVYGTAAGADSSAPATQQSISAVLGGLTLGTVYHYRAKAANFHGVTYSADHTFTTQATPSTPVITLDHSFENTATGTGNDQVEYTGASWTLCSGCEPTTPDDSFHYGYTAGQKYTLRFNGARLVIYAPNDTSGASAAPVTVDGVAAGTANFYHPTSGTRSNGVRFDTGPLGNTNADHVVVVTIPNTANKVVLFEHAEVYEVTAGGAVVNPPAVTGGAATSLTATSAVLSGIITPNGAATAWRFEYGTTTGYGSLAPVPDGEVPAGAAATVSATLSGLSASTLYHYRLKATNSAGTVYTADATFTTTAAGAAAGRITRGGTQLLLNGARYQFAGMEWPQATGCGQAPTPAQAAQYFAEINAESITKIWAFPGMDLAGYDVMFNAAKAAGKYLCVALFNGASLCTSYVPGYGTPLSATEASWIQQVCTRHANEPTVAMYECANEANEATGNIANWYQAVAALIKQYDPQALVGTGGGRELATASAIAAVASGAAVDMVGYHDTYAPAGTLGPRATMFNTASTSLGKPWYMSGRTFAAGGGDTGDLTANGQRLTAEYGLHLGLSNCAGYLYSVFQLTPAGSAIASFGNGLWGAARTFTPGGTVVPPDPPPVTPPTGGFWIFGGSANTNTEAATDSWQNDMAGGRPVTCVLAYPTRNGGWGALHSLTSGQVGAFTNKSRVMIIQISPFPTNVGATYSALVSGAYDSFWRDYGAKLLAREQSGFPPAIISHAWEMNGLYFQWGGVGGGSQYGSNQQYIDGYRRIVNAMRETYPNVQTAWVINGHASATQSNSYLIYPGDAYVTYIGGDWYNHFDGNPQTKAAFDQEANDPDGIRWMLAKVRAAGPDARGRTKKLIVPEWGVDANHGTPGDNPNWVEWMFRVFQDAHATGHMGPETYFNEAPASVWDIQYSKPNSRARYRALYSP